MMGRVLLVGGLSLNIVIIVLCMERAEVHRKSAPRHGECFGFGMVVVVAGLDYGEEMVMFSRFSLV